MRKNTRLAEALKNVANSRGSGDFLKFFKIPNGKTRIRILPASAQDDEEEWFIPVGQHYNVDKYAVLCPNETHWAREVCPICQAIEGLKSNGDIEGAKKIALKKSYYIRVLVRNNRDAVGVQYLRLPSTLFEAIGEIVFESEEYGDVLSWSKGRDIMIKRTGQGLDTKYSAAPAANPSPVDASKAVMKEIKDSLESFPPMVTPPSEEELRALIFGSEEEVEDDEDFEDFEEELDEDEGKPIPELIDPDEEDDTEGDEDPVFGDDEEDDEDWGIGPDDDSEDDELPALNEDAEEEQKKLKNSLSSRINKRKKK